MFYINGFNSKLTNKTPRLFIANHTHAYSLKNQPSISARNTPFKTSLPMSAVSRIKCDYLKLKSYSKLSASRYGNQTQLQSQLNIISFKYSFILYISVKITKFSISSN